MRSFLTTLVACGLVSPLLAQAPTSVLTLEMAIERALEHPLARAAAARARAARADSRAERTSLWPELSAAVTTNGGFSGSSAGLGVTGMNNSPLRRNYGLGLEAKGTVWDFGRTLGRIRAADRAADRFDAEADVVRQDLTLEVIRRYYTALGDRVVVTASIERVSAATALRDQIRALAGAGVRPGAELDLAELDLAAARSLQVEAEANALTARDRLLILVGLNLAEPTRIAEREPTIAEAPTVEGLYPTLGGRPELKAAQAAIDEARARRDAARAEFSPRIVATGSLGYANPPPGTDPGRWAGAAGVSVPLFGGIRDPHRIEAADARLAEQESRLEDTERALRTELVQVYEDVVAAFDLTRAYEEELRRADQAAAATRASFQAGLLPFVDVARANFAVADARAKLGETRYRYAIARAALARAAGLPIGTP